MRTVIKSGSGVEVSLSLWLCVCVCTFPHVLPRAARVGKDCLCVCMCLCTFNRANFALIRVRARFSPRTLLWCCGEVR